MFTAQEFLILNLLQLNLHVSLDDLQLLMGKEGDDQARRMLPKLQRWSKEPVSRQALWHAAQIFRYAKAFPTGRLKEIYAIAVQHAALCLWAHGVVTKATMASTMRGHPDANVPAAHDSSLVFLDGEESDLVHTFITTGQGTAAICGAQVREGQGAASAAAVVARLDDPRSCVEVAQDILRANFIDCFDGLPAISENIIHLLKQLGSAAWQLGNN
jgi:hypothetical protein